MYIIYILLLYIEIVFGNVNVSENEQSVSDKLLENDLFIYLKSLHNIIKFCLDNKNYIDINVRVGLFFSNVNLKSVIENDNENVPKDIMAYIKRLTNEIDELINYFNEMVQQDKEDDENYKHINSLFYDETIWMRSIGKLTPSQSNILHHGEQFKKNKGWQKYIYKISNWEEWIPTPFLSDKCLLMIAKGRLSCYLDNKADPEIKACYEMLVNGSDFGYALTHRLIFLTAGRISRGCDVISEDEDLELKTKFCSIAYNEAELIAKNNYWLIDLLLEQITVCGFEGYFQFVRRSWFTNALLHQTPYGCFGVGPWDSRRPAYDLHTTQPWKLTSNVDEDILGGACNVHVTTVAAGALATATRYIFEAYYSEIL